MSNLPDLNLHKSKLKLHTRKSREQRLASINIFETLPGDQTREPRAHHDVFTERRTILCPDPQVGADRMMNRPLEQNDLQRFGAVEAQIVSVHEPLQLRR